MRLKREGQKGKRRGYRGHKSSKLPYQRCSAGKWRQSRTFFVLEMKKSRSRSRYAYYAVTSHSTKYGWLHQNFINLLLLRFYVGNTDPIFLTIYYFRNDDIFKQLANFIYFISFSWYCTFANFENVNSFIRQFKSVINILWIIGINNSLKY